jgi:Fe-S-cluster-containing hydrogenase component 2
VTALSVNENTSAVLVDKDKCNSCGLCIDACPGQIPFLHPGDSKAVICDLCDGDPECSKVCTDARFDALRAIKEGIGWGGGLSKKLFAQIPEVLTKDVATNLFGDKAEEMDIDD